MSLRIISWKRIISRTLAVLVIGVVVTFLGRVFFWENDYYLSKEGSERAVAIAINATPEEEEVIEVPPTSTEVYEYIVRNGYPRYITIADLGIVNTRILEVGVKAGTKEMSVPNNIYDTGWYNGSAKPGEGRPIIIDGHSGGPNQTGIFRHLDWLGIGSQIQIEVGGGKIYTYEVVESVTKSLAESNKYLSGALNKNINDAETLTLISCTGEWSQVQYTYLSRQFVRAVLVK